MKYRKKPVVIEAFQMTEDRRWHNDEWPNWLHKAWEADNYEVGSLFPDPETGGKTLSIFTPDAPEGVHKVTPGDWIIQGVKGELYPCKPYIFEATYEEI